MQDLHDALRSSLIQIARRLVCENQRCPLGKRPCNGDALLLATRQLRGIAINLSLQAYTDQGSMSTFRSIFIRHSHRLHTEKHILHGCKR